jgi:hypothetical protein
VVIRVFDADFMLLDLLFTAFWIAILYRQGYIKALIFGCLGIILNFTIDFGIWYNIMGIRTVEGLPAGVSPLAFFIYFSITYGMVQYSYVQVMFTIRGTDSRNEGKRRLKWSLLLFGGWLLIAYLSKIIHLDNTEVTVARAMNEQRFIEVFVVIVEYLVLAILAHQKKYDLNMKRIGYIFFVGFFVHFSMEFTLLLPGIRRSSIFDLVFNSILEFNMGAPLLYLMLWILPPWFRRLREGEEPAKQQEVVKS